MISCRADHVTCNAVLSALAEADMANVLQGASGLDKHLDDFYFTSTSRLDDERRLAVNVVHIWIGGDGTHSLRRLPNIYSFLKQKFDDLGLLGVDSHLKLSQRQFYYLKTYLKELRALLSNINLIQERLDEVQVAHGYELA